MVKEITENRDHIIEEEEEEASVGSRVLFARVSFELDGWGSICKFLKTAHDEIIDENKWQEISSSFNVNP